VPATSRPAQWRARGEGRRVRQFTDITEQSGGKSLRRPEGRAAATQAKSTSCHMSHKSHAMNAIINMIELALETELPPKQQQYVSVAHAAARNLLASLTTS